MNGSTIERLLSENSVTNRYFYGVFAANKLPIPLDHVFSLIVNLDKSGEPGSHWVAIFAKGVTAFYFDSLGLPPHVDTIRDWLQRNFLKVFWNPIQHQRGDTSHCGGFAIYFVHNMSLGKTFSDVVSVFKMLNNDDRFITNFMQNVYGFSFQRVRAP